MESLQCNNSISFSLDDLELFSLASHDRNPLHLSTDYARKTPFANRVVFGVLGSLFALGHIQNRPGYQLAKVTLDFSAPLFTGISYSLKIVDSSAEKAVVRIFDGRRLMSKVTAHFRPGKPSRFTEFKPYASRTEAALLLAQDLQETLAFDDTYCPDGKALRDLADRFQLEDKGIGEVEIATLLWASYFVGMELPGCQALFSKLTLNFNEVATMLTPPLSYQAALSRFDDRYHLLQTEAQLAVDTTPVATAAIQAFIRPAPPTSTTASIETLMPRSTTLNGKVALVTGSSRGLGAAIAHSLALQGCTVLVNFLRSRSEAEDLQAALADAPGNVVLMQGNAADLSWCLEAKQEILDTYGRLDFLVCNACPAILPLWIEPTSIERVNEYVTKSLALMSVPMSVLLSLVSETSGTAIVVSSIYASQVFPPDLPHYVVAKFAIEGLAQVAATEYESVNFLLVRPPKLLTDQTNTPLGRQGAISAERVAVRIVERLTGENSEARIDVLEDDWGSPE